MPEMANVSKKMRSGTFQKQTGKKEMPTVGEVALKGPVSRIILRQPSFLTLVHQERNGRSTTFMWE